MKLSFTVLIGQRTSKQHPISTLLIARASVLRRQREIKTEEWIFTSMANLYKRQHEILDAFPKDCSRLTAVSVCLCVCARRGVFLLDTDGESEGAQKVQANAKCNKSTEDKGENMDLHECNR